MIKQQTLQNTSHVAFLYIQYQVMIDFLESHIVIAAEKFNDYIVSEVADLCNVLRSKQPLKPLAKLWLAGVFWLTCMFKMS